MEKTQSPLQICSRCVLPSSFPRISFDGKGVCSVCREYDKSWGDWNSKKNQKSKVLKKICNDAKNKHKEFDALIPLSGGKDSSYVLYVAKKKLGLNCLAYTLDSGYLSQPAKNNIEKTCRTLGIEHLYYCLDPDLTNRLFNLFIKKTGWFCSVCMRAIQMSTFRIADMYKIPLIIKGSSMRTEMPLSREMFQGGDPAHFQAVLEGEPIAHECGRLCERGAGFQRRLGYMMFLLSGQKRLLSYAYFNLAGYVDWDYRIIHDTIQREVAWSAPDEAEHMDCLIHPIQKYIHNKRFPTLKMNKLIYARQIMAGLITRQEALQQLEKEENDSCPESVMNMFLGNIDMTRQEFDDYIHMGPRHLQYHPAPNLSLRLAKKVFPIQDAGNY